MGLSVSPGFSFTPGAGGGSSAAAIQVTQPAHGFQVLDPIYLNIATGLWELAIANDASKLKEATVFTVADPDNFFLIISGIVNVPGHSLAFGEEYYISPTLPGGYTLVKPMTVGLFQQLHAYPIDAVHIKVFDQAVRSL